MDPLQHLQQQPHATRFGWDTVEIYVQTDASNTLIHMSLWQSGQASSQRPTQMGRCIPYGPVSRFDLSCEPCEPRLRLTTEVRLLQL